MTTVVVAIVLLLGNAFFVAAEFALVSARRAAIEPRAEAGSRAARAALSAMEDVSVMMACAQLGITLCSVGLGAIAEPAIAHAIAPALASIGASAGAADAIAVIIALLLVVFLHVVFGEMAPKNLALASPDRMAVAMALPLAFLATIVKPVIISLNAIANVTVRMLGVHPRNEVASAFTRDEVAVLVDHSHREGLLDADERDLVAGALALDTATISRVMIPRSALTTVPADVTPSTVEHIAGMTGFSRLPVESDGQLIGYVHLKDVLSAPDISIDARLIRPLARLQPDADLRAALSAMRTSGSHLGGVVDAAGIVVGVVALEDVLEELVGEIRDETRGAR